MDHLSPRRLTAAAALTILAFVLASCSSGTQTGPSPSGSGAGLDTSALLTVTPSLSAAQPGDAVVYAITVRNTTSATLKNITVTMAFPPEKLAITDAAGGAARDNAVTWTIPALAMNDVSALRCRGTIAASLAEGDLVRTVAELRAENLPEPAQAQAEVGIVAAGAVPSSGSSSSTDSGYSFFLGGSSSATSSASPSAPGNGRVTAVAVTQQADQAERQPGARVRYAITVRNLTATVLRDLTVQALIPPTLTVRSAGGGTLSDSALRWDLPTLGASQTMTFSYAGTVSPALRAGDTVSTIAQVSAPAIAVPQVVTTDVRIAGPMPETGDDVRFTAPPEDTSRFLRPVR